MTRWNFIIVLIFFTFLNLISVFANEKKNVILVLGSGGSKGLAHVGIIEELEKIGVVPNVIIGCSAGAIVGALYAQDQNIAMVKELFINMKYDDLIDISFFEKGALSTRKKMEDFLKKNLTTNDFSSLKIPFVAVATELNEGEPIYFKEGELHSAVLASAALPGLFPPYEIGGHTYVDASLKQKMLIFLLIIKTCFIQCL